VIIEKLLNYSQRSEEERELDINGIIEECTAFLDAQMTRDGILLEKDLAATNPVFGNPAEISQLAINLIMNARDAVMAIEDANRRRIAVRTFERDAMVCLEVSDRGTGIAEEHLGRILDPFFSTKDIGKGPGLGLWVCHQIVKKHGGEIDVCSRPGEGCVFTVRLPAAIRSQ
jgi:two-component system NtrC family sensor kinase